MNFLDPTDISRFATSTTPPPPAQSQNEPTLNEEVTQVMGQFSRFWGGVRRQSQVAFETARKDFGGVVVQAQKELTKLAGSTEETSTPQPASSSSSNEKAATNTESDNSTEPASPDRSPTPTLPLHQSIFSHLQSALPPSVVSTVQNHIPESIKHASEHGIDFNALRSNLQTEFQRAQGFTKAQAEEYVHKTEGLLRETFKEAQEVLRDAVKVVPPDPSSSGSGSGGGGSSMIWDGTDMWMLPSESFDATASTAGEKSASVRSSTLDTHRAVATRAEALLRRLKHDPSIIRHDPEADSAVKEMYVQWCSAQVESKEGGIEGKEWTAKVEDVLADPANGSGLKANLDTLVPAELTREVFWKRYFFRAHQIEQEEKKRKALLAGSHDSDDEFSWEDDEDDGATLAKPSEETSTSPKQSRESDSTQKAGTANTSPRDSSEESYDLVNSSNTSAAGDSKPSKAESDSDDSDWE